uniref:NHL repeat containing protein n=1 Tax=viral metagenome TaxID=1070528 RepID=A0A6C0L7Y9_9ZZZZ
MYSPYTNTRYASDVTYRNSYKTRFIGYTVEQQNTVGAIINILGGSGAANEASEVTYLTLGRTMVTGEELEKILNTIVPAPPQPSSASLFYDPTIIPFSIAILPDGTIFVSDSSSTLYKIVNGAKVPVNTGITGPPQSFTGMVVSNGILYLLDTANSKVYIGNSQGTPFTPIAITGLVNPTKIQVSGTSMYFLEQGVSSIKMASTTGGAAVAITSTTTGFADGVPAQFNMPMGFVVDAEGQNLYVADTGNSLIRSLSLTTYAASTLAGNSTLYNGPTPTDNVGNRDGNGIHGENLVYYPEDITISPSGTIYIADTFNNNIRQLTGGNLTTIAGLAGTEPVYDISPPGYTDGLGVTIRWNMPSGIQYVNGALYIIEPVNHSVRILQIP